MGKWVTKAEVFAATFSVATIWSCFLTLILMASFPNLYASSFLAPLIATYGPGLVAAIRVVKKLHVL